VYPSDDSGRNPKQAMLAEAAHSPVATALQGRAASADEALEERMIIELCLAGQVQAFRRLVERHQRGLVSLAYRMLGSRVEAEEIAQQSFVDAFVALRDFDPAYKFSSWIYRITINNCKDYLKSKKRTEQSLGEEVAQGEALFSAVLPDPERQLRERELAASLERALGELPIKYREVLLLKDVEQLSYQEIRSILRLPVTTLKIRVVRARRRLKQALERGEPDHGA
jgi:RNA polymerase sigma-70 factor (ECF subfamily)